VQDLLGKLHRDKYIIKTFYYLLTLLAAGTKTLILMILEVLIWSRMHGPVLTMTLDADVTAPRIVFLDLIDTDRIVLRV